MVSLFHQGVDFDDGLHHGHHDEQHEAAHGKEQDGFHQRGERRGAIFEFGLLQLCGAVQELVDAAGGFAVGEHVDQERRKLAAGPQRPGQGLAFPHPLGGNGDGLGQGHAADHLAAGVEGRKQGHATAGEDGQGAGEARGIEGAQVPAEDREAQQPGVPAALDVFFPQGGAAGEDGTYQHSQPIRVVWLPKDACAIENVAILGDGDRQATSDQGVVALFNPGATPPVVPAPTDLVRVGGKLQIPADPAEASNGALAAFNDYLRGLDGFPPDSTATTTFSGAIDPASIAEGVVIFDATTGTALTAPAAAASLDPSSGGTELVISTQNRWRNGHTYFVGVFSWQESGAVRGVRTADARPVLTDAAFALLRSTPPLYAL